MHVSFILYLFYLTNVQKVKMSDQEETLCQVFKDKLKERIQRLLTNGTIVKILQAQIKAATVLTTKSQERNCAATPLNEDSASIHP